MAIRTDTIPDEEILQRYRNDHNPEWMGILFERYMHLVLGVCIKYLKNMEDARDAAQQIFMKVMQEADHTQIQYFKGWLYQVTKNYCLMQLRGKSSADWLKQDENDTQWVVSPEDDEELLLKNEQLNQLEEALQQLNEPQQTCIRLFYLEKHSYQEIAEITGYTLMQVKSYIQNGKRNLRIMLEKKQKQLNNE
ncbi:RNA polymerase sigma factor [Thermoflavifilum thermophilum]|uniref:RNA polymerase sigma-70 factor, ECF subfamily n=1 Tax=Thermoflavifilum thermophilum TaxID=1393122 RepID=A0A1I7MXH4_9BACT|nr:sigma-70 family RNA polymerase sigma factor [Thermoflavifilum thermophilum]SFV27078.1 RNA polymerase sigma-70 factor, ECF subfamily [Thermoflavifilum thermophilum]